MSTVFFIRDKLNNPEEWLDNHTLKFYSIVNKLENFSELSSFLPEVGSSLNVKFEAGNHLQ